MHVEYLEVVRRLRKERQRLGWTQTELSSKLHMSQCNYCKAELGRINLNCISLKTLIQAGFDLHWIYTGEAFPHSKYQNLFTDCSQEELVFLAVSALPLIAEHALALPRKEAKVMQERASCLTALLHPETPEQGLLPQLRRHKKLTQRHMAELLGLDIKKYISLEKGRSFGDSEILLRVYNLFRLSPLLLLGSEDGLACELVSLLEGLCERDRQKLYTQLKHSLKEQPNHMEP